MKKPRNYGKNLGKYLHAKLPSGAKIGAGTVKRVGKAKIKKMKPVV
jgi:hypothetical protein